MFWTIRSTRLTPQIVLLHSAPFHRSPRSSRLAQRYRAAAPEIDLGGFSVVNQLSILFFASSATGPRASPPLPYRPRSSLPILSLYNVSLETVGSAIMRIKADGIPSVTVHRKVQAYILIPLSLSSKLIVLIVAVLFGDCSWIMEAATTTSERALLRCRRAVSIRTRRPKRLR